MEGGVGFLVILAVTLAAAVAAMLLLLNSRWKSREQIIREAGENLIGTMLLVALAVGALALVVLVVANLV